MKKLITIAIILISGCGSQVDLQGNCGDYEDGHMECYYTTEIYKLMIVGCVDGRWVTVEQCDNSCFDNDGYAWCDNPTGP